MSDRKMNSELAKYQIIERRNSELGLMLNSRYGANRPLAGWGVGTKYRNPLVQMKKNDPSNPLDRWYVSQYDSIANTLIGKFIQRALSPYPPQIYDTFGYEGVPNPLNEVIQSRLKKIKFWEWVQSAGERQMVHGYQATEVTLRKDSNGNVMSLNFDNVYGDHEIHQLVSNNAGAENFLLAKDIFPNSLGRLPDPNQLMGFNFTYMPDLPLYRGRGKRQMIRKRLIIGQNCFYSYNIIYNEGYGLSELSAAWDALIKLQEQSENNHFRQSIWAILRLNPSWRNNLDRAKNFAKKTVFALNNKQIMAMFPYEDREGKVTDVPKLEFQNTVSGSQPTKAQTTGVGALLDSEWSRLTANMTYTISYFMGEATADNPERIGDMKNDAARFGRLTNTLIIPFLKVLTELGVFYDILPEDFDWDSLYFKTHWDIEIDMRMKALMDASHYAQGEKVSTEGSTKSFIPKKDGGKPKDHGTPKKKNIEIDWTDYTNEDYEACVARKIPIIAEENGLSLKDEDERKQAVAIAFSYCEVDRENALKRKPSEYTEGKQKPIGEAGKVKKDLGKVKEISKRACIVAAKKKIKAASKDLTDQEIEAKAKQMCKSTEAKTESSKKGDVSVSSYKRDGDSVKGHSRSDPTLKQKSVDVGGYSRDGESVKSHTRHPGSKQNVFAFNGYMVEQGYSVEFLGNRLNSDVEYTEDDYEKEGKPERVDLREIYSPKLIELDDPKTKSLQKFFTDWHKKPEDLPNILCDGSGMILDGNHRHFVYRMLGFPNTIIQFMKRKGEMNYLLTDRKSNFAMPMLAVASSIVKGVGVKDDKLILQFHPNKGEIGSGGTYQYTIGSDEKAKEYYDSMMYDAPSKGGFMWDMLRGKHVGPAWGTGKPTPGGTTASIEPYEKMGRTPVGTYAGYKDYTEKAEELKEWKIKEFGTSRDRERVQPQHVTPQKTIPGLVSMGVQQIAQKKAKASNPQNITKSATTPKKINDELANLFGVCENGQCFGMPTEKINEEFLGSDSEYWLGSVNNIVKTLGGSKTKYYNTEKSWELNRFNKYNADFEQEDDEYWYALVNGFSTSNKFNYYEKGRVVTEFQCPEEIIAQIGKEVPLGVYHNKKKDTFIPDWQKVGSYKVLAYNKEEGIDVARLKVNKKRVKEVFAKLNEDDWITPLFEMGKCPDISTAYPAVVKLVKHEGKLKRLQTKIRLDSVSFVKKGNCSYPNCNGEIIRLNGMMRDCVKVNIALIVNTKKEKGKSLDFDEVLNEAMKMCGYSY